MNKGIIKFDRVVLGEMLEDVNSAKSIFTNFYPSSIIDDFRNREFVTYFGYSEHFDAVEEGELSTSYDMIFVKNDVGIVEFKEMKRI